MKTNLLKSMYATIFMAAMFLVSCDNNADQQGTETEEEQTLESASISEDETDDVLEITYQTETELVSTDGRVRTTSCADVTNDTENNIITIDFGDGCVGPHGRTRKGKIFIAYSSGLGDSLANRIITFENYFVNNKGITGTIELLICIFSAMLSTFILFSIFLISSCNKL